MFKKAIAHSNGQVPYGYIRDPHVKKQINPDEEALTHLDSVLDYLDMKSFSYRQAATYLNAISKVKITHEGLRKLHRDRKHPIFTSRDERKTIS